MPVLIWRYIFNNPKWGSRHKGGIRRMSDFSEKLAHEIRNTNKPLRYLAEASGLQLDYISKMCRGKRIPQDEEKLKKLLDAMECVMRRKWEKSGGIV